MLLVRVSPTPKEHRTKGSQRSEKQPQEEQLEEQKAKGSRSGCAIKVCNAFLHSLEPNIRKYQSKASIGLGGRRLGL